MCSCKHFARTLTSYHSCPLRILTVSHGPDFVRPEQHEFTPDLFPSQGPGVLSGEQDVSPESGSGSGPKSVSDSEPGSAQTHQRVHHPPHTAVSGK